MFAEHDPEFDRIGGGARARPGPERLRAQQPRQPRRWRRLWRRRARAACRNSTRPSATAFSSTLIRPISRRQPRRRSTSRRRGSISTTNTASPSRATPTSAARANTISRSARAAPRRCTTISPPRASPPSRMRTISYGKERPVAVCDDISCWSQNRRAVTVLNGAPEQLSAALRAGARACDTT